AYKEAFRNNLIAISRIAKAHGIAVVFMTQPGNFHEDKVALMYGYKDYNDDILYPKPDEFRKIFQEYNKVIMEVAEQEGAYFIDMNSNIGEDDDLFIDTVHFTPEGIKKFAEFYAKDLKVFIETDLANRKS
ncbi:SGNH/GDSL hydrolase family protein, partial [Candidatus Woesearchaeota archaeon]|nr:SGNH/GDSL hydrolase family protein [Candidatus Woesearchaeota archaeon]